MNFNLKNINIDVSYYFIAIISLILINDTTNISKYFLLSIIIHEIGHLIFIYLFKLSPSQILFKAYGIHIKLDETCSISYKKELIILFAGPIANFIFSLILFCLDNNQLLYFSIINIIIGCFNLLPITSLDGGRINNIVLCYFLSPRVSYNISFFISIIFTVIFLILDFFLIIHGQFYITLSIFCIMLIFKVFTPN